MLIYNITTQITWPIHEAWVKWMQEEHIPEVMESGCFATVRFVRLLETDETEGPTYAVQFQADSRTEYDEYLAQYAPGLRKEAMEKWGNQFISFRSLMEVVN
ncbi:MAG: hypothetical protein JWQ78_1071 [Sediminibacterium sp.]|nr:hypothetical protein [Sediminibacterium sp.]